MPKEVVSLSTHGKNFSNVCFTISYGNFPKLKGCKDMFDQRFWIAASERAIKTFAQALLALIGTGMVGVLELDWLQMFSVAITATIVSVLTSIVSANFGPNPGPSLADETIEPEPILVEVEVKK